jgi:hypothetical protein
VNAASVAALLRELAEEFDQMAADARPEPANEVRPKPRLKRRAPPPIALPVPSELDRAAARAELRRLGYRPR